MFRARSEEHTSELQSRQYLVCRLLLEKKKQKHTNTATDTSEQQDSLATPRSSRCARLSLICVADNIGCTFMFIFFVFFFFFLNNPATPEISPFPPPAALPI